MKPPPAVIDYHIGTNFFCYPQATMFRKIKKFSTLNTPQKILFLEAYTTLIVLRLVISLVPLRTILKAKQVHSPTVPATSNYQLITAINTGKAVRAAANNTPWKSACLMQALTAQRMLAKRKIPGLFFIGARLDKEAKEKQRLKAHAWLQCSHHIITGDTGHIQHKILSVFTWSTS